MKVIWIPFDFTAMPVEQQDQMFVAWCKLVMDNLKNHDAKGVLKFEEKGPQEFMKTNIQSAQVWIEASGKKLKTNLLVAFNDMLENDCPNASKPDIRRNDPDWYAGSLVDRAKGWEANPPSEGYGLLPWPLKSDIEVY